MDARPYVNPQFYLEKWHQATNDIAARPAFAGLRMSPSDAKAFPAATFSGYVGISKAKCFIEAFLYEVDLGAVDELQAFAVNNHLDSACVENDIVVVQLVRIIDNVGKPVATGRSDANSQSNAAASVCEVAADAFGGGFGK